MSLRDHQKTCASCGKEITAEENYNIEPLVDDSIRYVLTHWDHSTFIHRDSFTDPEQDPGYLDI